MFFALRFRELSFLFALAVVSVNANGAAVGEDCTVGGDMACASMNCTCDDDDCNTSSCGEPPCMSNDDCSGEPGTVCSTNTGACVQPGVITAPCSSNADCNAGNYCFTAGGMCFEDLNYVPPQTQTPPQAGAAAAAGSAAPRVTEVSSVAVVAMVTIAAVVVSRGV